MRLIDADALEEDLLKMHESKEMNSRDRELIAYCISHVRQQSTAYDVDKVVKNIKSIMDDDSIRFVEKAVNASMNYEKEGIATSGNLQRKAEFQKSMDVILKGVE